MLNFYQGPIQFSKHLFVGIDALARRRFMSILVVFFLSFGGSWLWALLRGIPIPYVHDEFSYLLAGDTFAHGRVTNPTHPMWEHFETFHELMKPTYMSKFPPGQGLFLAVGQVIFGHPIYGVWLSSALMCAAICWMLYAWISPRWALIGGLVAVLQFGIFTYWSQSYWGGAVAAMGGALVFGALPRILKTQRIRDALWLGLGCAVLANSRPLEGFLVAIPVGCLVLPWKIRWEEVFSVEHMRRRIVLAKFIKRIVLPLSIILFITILGIGAYNKQITGDSKIFPHFLYDNTYSSVPLFIFQPLGPSPHLNHIIMGTYEQYFLKMHYIEKRTMESFVESMQKDSFRLLKFFFGFPLAIPSLVILLLFLRYQRMPLRCIVAIFILLCEYGSVSYKASPHSLSSLTCFAVLLITIGLRGLFWLSFRKMQAGPALIIFLIGLQLLLNIILTPVQPAVRSLANGSSQINLPKIFSREALKNILMKRGGKYLVIVKYPLSHHYFWEWVYNDAGIDHAPIVWARDMGTTRDAKLLNYFKDRQVLFIDIVWDIKNYPLYCARQ